MDRPQEHDGGEQAEILQGRLDVMVLKTLAAIGPFDSHGIARRMAQISERALEINRGTIYASPVRLQLRRLRLVGKRPQGEVLLHQKSAASRCRQRRRPERGSPE